MDTEGTAPGNESNLIALAADIVSAYVSNNSVATGDLPNLINDVHSALKRTGAPAAPERDKPEPAVPTKRSVTPDYIISLFDGRKYKSLKRHIRTAHGMTPQQYREFWGLAPDYPMVAPNYAKARSELARSMGLGQKAAGRKRSAKRAKKAA
jgi:predicted transcriptional regulator